MLQLNVTAKDASPDRPRCFETLTANCLFGSKYHFDITSLKNRNDFFTKCEPALLSTGIHIPCKSIFGLAGQNLKVKFCNFSQLHTPNKLL